MHAIESYTVWNIDKNSYAMHTIKITPNLLFEYQCTSGKFIRLRNRMEKNRFVSENRVESNRNFFARIGMLYQPVVWLHNKASNGRKNGPMLKQKTRKKIRNGTCTWNITLQKVDRL